MGADEPADGGAPSLLAYSLRDLHSAEVHDLARYRGAPTLVLLFEPECAWCRRQVAVLNDLGDCVQRVAIGVDGGRRRLIEALHNMKPSFPAYQASAAFVRDLGGSPPTPQLLLADAEGRYVTHLRGYQDREALTRALADWNLAVGCV